MDKTGEAGGSLRAGIGERPARPRDTTLPSMPGSRLVVLRKPWGLGRSGLKWWLLGATVTLAILASAAFLASKQRMIDLMDLTLYNDVFDASQIQAEFLRLEAEIGRYGVGPTSDGADIVALRLEIFRNHVDMMKQGIVGGAIEAAQPGLSSRLDEATTGVERVVAKIRTAGDASIALDLLMPFEVPLAHLTASVNEQSAAGIKATGESFRSVRNMLVALTIGLLAGALGLAFVLWRQQTALQRLAYRDTLTGLANRFAFHAALDLLVADTRGPVAALLADIDLFKDVNDGFGHDIGDMLLQQMARRLEAAVPEAAVIARLGGDEFAILLAGPITARDAATLADRVCAAAAAPFRVGNLLLRSGLSVGIVVDEAGGRDPVGLLKRADLALYAAKAAGRGRPCLFDPALEHDFLARREMEQDLRAAVAEDRIEVHFQPVVDLATGRPLACETLARWNHHRHGWIPPSQFIAIAEQDALIIALGERVLARACACAVAWPSDVRVAVNVSSKQLKEADFADRVIAVLAATGLDARRLELEITETVLLQSDADVFDAIHRLKRLGVTFALDDFGTGYSSFAHLHRLPLDKIKIDRSFVAAMEESEEAHGILEAIVDLARKLRLTTTAEGVETESQRAILERAGCGLGQGYLFGRPVPPRDCLALLEGRPARSTFGARAA